MLTGCVAPPLPNHELPHQVSIQPSPGQRVFEIVTPPGGLLVRRLAADLAGLGHEVAWVRPPPFEPDLSSLASLLLMALAAARRPMSAGREPVIVMESPTSAQAGLLGELLTPYAPGAFTPSVVLIVNVRLRTCVISADATLLKPPSCSAHLARGLVPGHAGRALSLAHALLRTSQPASSGGTSIPSMRAAAPRRTRAESGGAHAATVRANPQTPARVIAGLVIARPE
jgi:hypothetical protein